MNDENLVNTIPDTSDRKAIWHASCFFFLLMIMEIPFSFFLILIQSLFPEKYFSVVSIVLSQGYFLLGGILYMLIFKLKFGRDLNVKKYRISSFFLSLLVLVTAAPMASWLNVFSQLFAPNNTAKMIMNMVETTPIYVSIFVIGCLPGFIEEFLYRGIVFSAFKKYSVLVGVLVSALCFGFMHMNFNQILYAVYLGIVFALIVEVTGSLASTMILHMLFNVANTLYIYILPKMYEVMNQNLPSGQKLDIDKMMAATPSKSQLGIMVLFMAPFAIGSIILTVLLLKQIAKMNGKSLTWATMCEKKTDYISKKTVFNVFLILGLVFCIINAITNLLMPNGM